MIRFARIARWSLLATVLGLVVVGQLAFAQGHGSTVIFTARRPPRDMVGNIRGWAQANRSTSYNEDLAAHTWHVTFMVFLSRSPNVAEVQLAWFHIEANRQRTYVSNEPIALSDPTQQIFVHSTSLPRSTSEFQPMEHYEAVVSYNDARGSHELARGQIQLIGQVERHSGVVDFTGAQPTAQ